MAGGTCEEPAELFGLRAVVAHVENQGHRRGFSWPTLPAVEPEGLSRSPVPRGSQPARLQRPRQPRRKGLWSEQSCPRLRVLWRAVRSRWAWHCSVGIVSRAGKRGETTIRNEPNGPRKIPRALR